MGFSAGEIAEFNRLGYNDKFERFMYLMVNDLINHTDNSLKVDTEISVSGDVIVEKVKIEDPCAGTQTNDVKVDINAFSYAGNLPIDIKVDSVGLAKESGGNLDTISGDTTSLDTKIPAQGQALMAASMPVVVASDQTAIPITGSITADITGDHADLDSGAGTDEHEVFAIGLPGAGGHVVGGTTADPLRIDPVGTTNQPVDVAVDSVGLAKETGGNLDTITTNTGTIAGDTTSIDGKIPTKTGAGNQPVDIKVDTVGLAKESGGNLDTISGDTTSIDGKIPSQGQAAMAASLPVVIASDQSTVPISGSIKDGDSATLLDVETDSAKNAAFVQSESLAKESGGNLAGIKTDTATIAGDTTSIDGKITACDTGAVGVTSMASGKTIKWAKIDHAANGDNTIIAAVATKKIKVIGLFLVANAAVNVKIKNGAGTDLTGALAMDAQGAGFVLPISGTPDVTWFETSVNTALIINLSAAVQVSGSITYYEEA